MENSTAPSFHSVSARWAVTHGHYALCFAWGCQEQQSQDQGPCCTGLRPHIKGQTTWKAGCCFPEMPGEQLLCLEDSPQHHFPVVPSGRRAAPPRHRDIAFQVPLASKTDVRKLSLHRCCFTSTCRCCSLCRVQSSLVLQPGYHPSQVEEIINLFLISFRSGCSWSKNKKHSLTAKSNRLWVTDYFKLS